jgi:demethylmenaquinone methyltransferase / 2-methoxy-6-polyprenyl-1,4-benzoquinol methylase
LFDFLSSFHSRRLYHSGFDDVVIWRFSHFEVTKGMGLFRKTAEGDPLPVTIAAVTLGNRFLGVGVRDPALIAVLARKAGLTGTACAVDADEAAVKKAAAAIEAAGVLAEVICAPWGLWPYDEGSFDIAVIRDLLPALSSDHRAQCVSEVLRVLRPGGRALVLESAPRGGFGALLSGWGGSPSTGVSRTAGGSRTASAYEGPVRALKDGGFAAVRLLSEVDGVLYAEGIKKA